MGPKLKDRYDPDSVENRNETLLNLFTPLVGSLIKKYFRAEVRGVENIPPGAALYVGNHNMGMLTLDSAVFFYEVHKAHGVDALPFGLAHDIGVTPPFKYAVVPVGGIRASHENAAKVFAKGRKVLVYPGGDVDSYRPFRNRNKIVFGGRTGYIRLALSQGVPIVPVVAAGAHQAFIVVDDNRWLANALNLQKSVFRTNVWPLTLCLPWGVLFAPTPFYIPFPTKILMEVLPPIHFERSGKEAAADKEYVRACADRVEGAMQDTLTRLAKRREEKKLFRRLEKGVRKRLPF